MPGVKLPLIAVGARRPYAGSAIRTEHLMRFQDRRDAGRHLAERLRHFAGRSDVVVLGLPRGGVPVAAEIAAVLRTPVDVVNVRKLGVPGHEEFAMGAIAVGGVRVLDERSIERLGIPRAAVEQVAEDERFELARREQRYRHGRPPAPLGGRTVILVDDGLATGLTMQAAIRSVRALGPARVVVAVPVAPRDALDALTTLADDVVCLHVPEPFFAVGSWYDDFAPVDDAEVEACLRVTAASGAE